MTALYIYLYVSIGFGIACDYFDSLPKEEQQKKANIGAVVILTFVAPLGFPVIFARAITRIARGNE